MSSSRTSANATNGGPCTLSAVSYAGLSAATPDGRPAKLAVVDHEGKIIADGPEVAQAAWEVCVNAYRNFLMGNGHLRVLSGPPKIPN